jgi:hypothetical protein
MKINSIGVEAYRQVANDAQVARREIPGESEAKTGQAEKIQISGQGEATGSKLAVQLKSGSFIDMLSAEEKKALEIVFEKFRAVNFDNRQYDHNGVAKKSHLGNIIDVKL